MPPSTGTRHQSPLPAVTAATTAAAAAPSPRRPASGRSAITVPTAAPAAQECNLSDERPVQYLSGTPPGPIAFPAELILSILPRWTARVARGHPAAARRRPNPFTTLISFIYLSSQAFLILISFNFGHNCGFEGFLAADRGGRGRRAGRGALAALTPAGVARLTPAPRGMCHANH